MPLGAHETMETHECLMDKLNAITHYNLYAQQTKNPQLLDMLERHLQEAIRSYNEFISLAKGNSPLGAVPSHTEMQEAGHQEIKYGLHNPPQYAPQTDASLSDREIAVALLLSHKNGARSCTSAALECADPNLRQAMQNSAAACTNHAYEVFLWMNEQGMYQVPTMQNQTTQNFLDSYQPASEDVQAQFAGADGTGGVIAEQSYTGGVIAEQSYTGGVIAGQGYTGGASRQAGYQPIGYQQTNNQQTNYQQPGYQLNAYPQNNYQETGYKEGYSGQSTAHHESNYRHTGYQRNDNYQQTGYQRDSYFPEGYRQDHNRQSGYRQGGTLRESYVQSNQQSAYRQGGYPQGGAQRESYLQSSQQQGNAQSDYQQGFTQHESYQQGGAQRESYLQSSQQQGSAQSESYQQGGPHPGRYQSGGYQREGYQSNVGQTGNTPSSDAGSISGSKDSALQGGGVGTGTASHRSGPVRSTDTPIH